MPDDTNDSPNDNLITLADIATLDRMHQLYLETLVACIELSRPLSQITRRLASEDAVDVFPNLTEAQSVAAAQALILASMVVKIDELAALNRIEKEGMDNGSK